MKTLPFAATLIIAGLPFTAAGAQTIEDEIAELRQLVTEMRADYEERIGELETRLATAEGLARRATRDADEAIELAEETAVGQGSAASAANTFNPSIGAILTGRYADIDTGWDAIPGFQPAGEIGSGESGFGVGEVELNLKANVDQKYFGNVTVAVVDEDGETEVEFEEAWLQTTDLPSGLTVTGGRFFSTAGYLNQFHFHADDFVDRPLPYQAFYGGRYTIDGLRAQWVAPTPLLLEVGAELNWGGAFPATANAGSDVDAWTIFTHLGGDVGDSHSWQLGLSRVDADAIDRESDGGLFTGSSDLTAVDFVWKWAPQGNPNVRNFKVQGEFFRRSEDGLFDGLAYDASQDGWYLQGILQFRPMWRVGYRYDVVSAGSGPAFAGTEIEDPGRDSERNTIMFDWSPSEFSRLRLQYAHDKVLASSDQQWFLQYIMSLGAHGAHQF